MQGNWSDRRAQIIEEQSGQTAAYIDRKRFSGREIVFGQDTYSVAVAPGVDAALIAALCICFDEKKDDE